MLGFLIPFLVALVTAAVVMPLTIWISRRAGMLDAPEARKVHLNPTPRLGGIAIFAGIVTGSIAAFLVHHFAGTPIESELLTKLVAILTATGFVFVVGVIDDIRSVSSRFKLFTLIAAAAMVCGSGISWGVITYGGKPMVNLYWVSWLLTVGWVIAFAVAINFIDGLDGLAGGLTFFAAAILAIVLFAVDQAAAAILPLVLAGALIGFLFYNWHPAKSFMGDGGSLSIGFLLAVSIVFANQVSGTMKGAVLPTLALLIPLVDAVFTIFRRHYHQRRSIFSAERGHIHHRLLDRGFTHRTVVVILYAASLTGILIGLVTMSFTSPAKVGGLILVLPLVWGTFKLAGSMKTTEMVKAYRAKKHADRTARMYRTAFEKSQLEFHHVENFGQWWETVCEAASGLDFTRMTLLLPTEKGEDRRMIWESDVQRGDLDRNIQVAIPVKTGPDPMPVASVTVEVSTHQTPESPFVRLGLFTRLLCEHGLDEVHRKQNRARSGIRSRGGIKSTHKPRNVDDTTVIPKVKSPDAVKGDVGPGHHQVVAAAIPDIDSTASLVTDEPTDSRESDIPGENGAAHPVGFLGLSKGTTLAPTVNSSAVSNRIDFESLDDLRVCIAHDFLYTVGGAERVVEQLIAAFPQADVFALFDFLPDDQRGFLQGKHVTTSFIQNLPFARKKHRAYLPLMPLAIEQLDVTHYDLVISSSYLAAKGVITGPDQLHVCYCHSPVRYAWDLQNHYLARAGLGFGPRGLIARTILHYIRSWDVRTSIGVDQYISNSHFVAGRIRKLYRRHAVVVPPPVAVASDSLSELPREDFYLIVGRMVPYKMTDMMVGAFAKMPDRKLVVIGEGPDFDRVEKVAGGNVQLLGYRSDEEVKDYMRRAKALLFAAEEDFGIVPVESLACGTPVIAFGRGGVTETVIDGVHGILYDEQSEGSLIEAIERFEQQLDFGAFEPAALHARAAEFSSERFVDQIRTQIGHWCDRKWRTPEPQNI
jgi:UDP-N-acetylmuramyl pentapeptide phosphotransferase/UDP-N-acetylglucosamine-1-phosphate transferase/glycosyltransferase involved in cell wall biosynthesis